MGKTEKQLLKSLRYNETLVSIANDDILLVTRNTKGNLLPGYSQSMTLREAVDFGAWDSVSGTMEYEVTLHPDHYKNPIPVYVKNGFAYGIEIDENA